MASAQPLPPDEAPIPLALTGAPEEVEPASASALVPAPRAPQRVWATFEPEELAVVCSNYDLGAITEIQAFRRGSSRAPKVIIRAANGDFLLKRRAPGKDNPFRVALSHSVQLLLARKQFPLPRLVGTRADGNSMLQIRARIYEMFTFLKGDRFPGTASASGDAARALGWFHRLLADFKPSWTPPPGTYHSSAGVRAALDSLPKALGSHAGAMAADLASEYLDAASHADALGVSGWEANVIHGDWHPGNMLFCGERVQGVVDYDSVRLAPRVIDIANGALQFSIVRGGRDVTRWPEGLDLHRYRRFLERYDSVDGCRLTEAELKVLPWLMIESFIAETAIPLAETGNLGELDGLKSLEMVRRKVGWIRNQASTLAGFLE